MIDKIKCENRIGNDIHKELIAMWNKLQKGWIFIVFLYASLLSSLGVIPSALNPLAYPPKLSFKYQIE